MSKMLVEFKPSGPRAIVKKYEIGEMKLGQVILPSSAQGLVPDAAEIVEPGEGKLITSTGQRLAPAYAKGDIVLLAAWQGYVLNIAGVEHLLINEENIIGKATFAEPNA